MHIQADRALIPAHSLSVRHLTIQITAPGRKASGDERPPVNVALVLDRSGSMDGQKIAMARDAVANAIKLLTVRDRLALVIYDDRVDVILRATAASAETKKKALDRLAEVEARGSTNLSGGWFQGAEQVAGSEHTSVASANAAQQSGITRVLLLTDGLANQGVVEPGELASAARGFRDRGIVTSTFGVGADFDEELLSNIATEGGGHFYFIEKPTQIPDFLASELGESLEVVASDVVLDLTCSPGLETTVLSGFAVETAPGRVRVKLGDLVADQEVTIAVAISCSEQLLETIAFVDCRVTDRGAVLYQEPMRVEWRAADAGEDARQPVNDNVLASVAEVLAERARATALTANRRGDYDDARRVIRDVIEHLRGLAAGNRRTLEIVDDLRRAERELGAPMDALSRKARHFVAYARVQSRDNDGKARRVPIDSARRTT